MTFRNGDAEDTHPQRRPLRLLRHRRFCPGSSLLGRVAVSQTPSARRRIPHLARPCVLARCRAQPPRRRACRRHISSGPLISSALAKLMPVIDSTHPWLLPRQGRQLSDAASTARQQIEEHGRVALIRRHAHPERPQNGLSPPLLVLIAALGRAEGTLGGVQLPGQRVVESLFEIDNLFNLSTISSLSVSIYSEILRRGTERPTRENMPFSNAFATISGISRSLSLHILAIPSTALSKSAS